MACDMVFLWVELFSALTVAELNESFQWELIQLSGTYPLRQLRQSVSVVRGVRACRRAGAARPVESLLIDEFSLKSLLSSSIHTLSPGGRMPPYTAVGTSAATILTGRSN